ncbi:MAG TPA: type II CAAX endopeptidase family protein [Solirubrobacteraceae bacterium]|nr:type II CAAX endopeptidase family protein [Solirubrobacteraceae bacterium]
MDLSPSGSRPLLGGGEEPRPEDGSAKEDGSAREDALAHDGASRAERRPSAASEWSPWYAPLALIAGLVFATVGALIIDIPAAAFGVDVNAKHLAPGLTIADTAVQDAGFVLVAVFFAQIGGRVVSPEMFGLRPTRLRRAVWLGFLTLLGFFVFTLVWGTIFHSEQEKLLEQLGAENSTLLLLLSAALTCVVAPIGEEFLFRGFVFTALRNWRGVWPAALITGVLFGAVHAGSAPAVDLVPLGVLGVGLCLLYRATGSLYPCIAAHCVNNSIAFGSLENWSWQIPVLLLAALSVLTALAFALTRAGITSRVPAPA